MSWIAVGGAAVTAVAGYASSKAKSKADAKLAGQSGAMTEQESKLAMQRSAFDNYDDYRYRQLDKQERQRGMDEFRKFNTVQDFAPGYVNTAPRVVVPKIIDPITPGMEHKIEPEV